MMAQAVRLRWTILKTCIEERLVYRGDFAFGTLVRFLPTVTQIFLWGAIYSAASADPGRKLNGYTYRNMIAYYLLVHAEPRAFPACPGLPRESRLEIRDGTIKKYLTQPIDMLGYLFWHRVAHKLVYYVDRNGPFVFVFWLCRGYFGGWPDGADDCRLGGVALAVVPVGLSDGGADRADRFLVPRSQLARLHLHDDQRFPLGSDDSARLVAGRHQPARSNSCRSSIWPISPRPIMLRRYTHAAIGH